MQVDELLLHFLSSCLGKEPLKEAIHELLPSDWWFEPLFECKPLCPSYICQLTLDHLDLLVLGDTSCSYEVGHIHQPLFCIQRLFCTGKGGRLQLLESEMFPGFGSRGAVDLSVDAVAVC